MWHLRSTSKPISTSSRKAVKLAVLVIRLPSLGCLNYSLGPHESFHQMPGWNHSILCVCMWYFPTILWKWRALSLADLFPVDAGGCPCLIGSECASLCNIKNDWPGGSQNQVHTLILGILKKQWHLQSKKTSMITPRTQNSDLFTCCEDTITKFLPISLF